MCKYAVAVMAVDACCVLRSRVFARPGIELLRTEPNKKGSHTAMFSLHLSFVGIGGDACDRGTPLSYA